jgi:dihydropteroate synthase
MGVLNVTPDSFSDPGLHLAPEAALARLNEMAGEGAAICDLGAESTRPGAEPVPPGEQLRRLDGLLRELAGGPPPLPLSIDTSSARVAGAALGAGAVLVNDVTAGRADPALLPLVAERGAAVCLMHMQGTPATMQRDPRYGDVVAEVRDALAERLGAAVDAGVPEERVLLDPGIGFGKTLDHNLALLAGLPALAGLGRPLVVGVSRKGMFGKLLGRPVDRRLAGSLAAGLAAVARGAAVIRAHDVAETVDALRVWSAVGEAG